MKKYYPRVLVISIYIAILIIYLGFLGHESEVHFIFKYSLKYFVFLIGMLLMFFIPRIIHTFFKSIIRKESFFIIVINIILMYAVYSGVATIYYHSRKPQTHLFDPYLQISTPQICSSSSKTSNTYRILCLGGSTTLCEDMPEGSTYPDMLGKILQDRYPSLNMEVLNAGQHWFTSKHSLISYVTYYQEWEPDLIIEMQGINDMYRSFSPPRYAIGKYNDQWSHFYGPAIDGALQYPPPTFEDAIYNRLSSLAYKIAAAWYDGILLKVARKYNDARKVEETKDYSIDKFISLNVFEKYLKWTVRCAKNNKANIFLVTHPSLYKGVMNTEEVRVLWFGRHFCYSRKNAVSIEYPNYRSLYHAMDAFNRIVAKVALSEDAGFVDAAARIPKNLQNFGDDCHLTEAGAKLLAQVITEEIIKSGVIDEYGYRTNSLPR